MGDAVRAMGLWSPAPRRIAVFRALNLGDFLCTVPALRALRRAAPRARITLIGLEGMRPCVGRFGRYIDEFVDFPGDPAFPEQPARLSALPAFYGDMRARRFDLALQMHGSGARSNAIVRNLGALQWAGFVPDRIRKTPLLMPWPDTLPEVRRYLALLEHLGLPKGEDAALELPLDARDRARAAELAGRMRLDPARTVFLHPGARLASRRWPPARFAAVGRRLAGEGWRIAVTGSEAERPMAAGLAAAIGRQAVDLSGMTDLGMLAGLLERARLLICNDTGVSHVAAAVRAPSVVIASGSDVGRWAPLDTSLHTVLHVDTPCRPCAHAECPVPGHPCATGVGVDQVVEAALRRLAPGARQ